MQFIDLKTQYRRIQDSVNRRMNVVLEHGNYILGPEIQELERKLAEYCGATHCLTCASGTDALLLPLMALGIGKGDAVFTTPFTFIATAEVIALLGATPVYVDIDPKTYNIDPEKLDVAVNDVTHGKKPASGIPDGLKPRCIIPVDIFGLPADYDAIHRIAKKYGLSVIEDAAQSFGATYKGKKACSLADIAATSFFPAKPLGCYGDGGAVFTNNKELAEKLESLRVHGKGTDKYDNVRIGINGRFDSLQAAIVLAKMEVFAQEVEMRQAVALRYSEGLKNSVSVPYIPEGYMSVWAQYSILSDKKDTCMQNLTKAGIPTAVYYPKPLHLQTAFSYLGYKKGSMPVSEQIAEKIFSIPMHPYLNQEDQDKIMTIIKDAV